MENINGEDGCKFIHEHYLNKTNVFLGVILLADPLVM